MAAAIPEPVNRLIEAFSQLPGVGPKTASRLTFYLLRRPAEQSEALAEARQSLENYIERPENMRLVPQLLAELFDQYRERS